MKKHRDYARDNTKRETLLRKLQKEVGSWTNKNFPEGKPYQPLLGLIEELGELAHAHLKNEQGIRGYTSPYKTDNEKIDAIGDLVIYLADYCERNDFDLHDCVMLTWEEVKARDWIENPERGEN